jgi:DUF4097 and DUF4098 domain-containing protein YvlB
MTASLFAIVLATLAGRPDTTLRLPRNGAIEIETHSRAIIVRIGTTDQVIIKGGDAELEGGTLQVSADEKHGRNGREASGALEVTVPSWSRLDVSSMLGSLTFTGTPEQLHAETVNGFIHVTGGSGTVELESVAGAVVVSDFHGTRLAIDATGDNVTVTNSTGVVEVENVNGNILLRAMRSAAITANTINGSVDFAGTLTVTGNYEFSSQNSNVTLTLPADVSARMVVSTMNGGLDTEIPAMTDSRNRQRSDRGKGKNKEDGDEHDFVIVFGAGSARVSVDVFNGNVIVKKAVGR